MSLANLLNEHFSPCPILLDDGSIGQQIKLVLGSSAFSPGASFDHRALVISLHHKYIQAGAKILSTNTNGADAFNIGIYREKAVLKVTENLVHACNTEGVNLARQVIGGNNILIAGSIGPISDQLGEPSVRLSQDLVRDAYRPQIEALAQAKVDLFRIEYIFSVDEATIALELCQSIAPQIPVVMMFSCKYDGKIPPKSKVGLEDVIALMARKRIAHGSMLYDDVTQLYKDELDQMVAQRDVQALRNSLPKVYGDSSSALEAIRAVQKKGVRGVGYSGLGCALEFCSLVQLTMPVLEKDTILFLKPFLSGKSNSIPGYDQLITRVRKYTNRRFVLGGGNGTAPYNIEFIRNLLKLY